MAVDHYNTLGVVPSATAADLRTAYLKLARATHPDRFDWNVLGVAHKRREYDAKQPGPTARSGSASGSSSASKDPGHQRRGHAHFMPLDEGPTDWPDIDLDATPIAGSRNIPRWVTFLPVVLFIFGILTLGFGTMVDAPAVFALGLMSLALGGVVVMSRAERDPDL